MKRPGRRVGKTVKKPRRKSAAARRSSPTQSATARTSQARLNVLKRVLAEARQQQTATSDVLRQILNSPSDVQPVLDAIAQSAARLCNALDAFVQLREGNSVRYVAHYGGIPTSP